MNDNNVEYLLVGGYAVIFHGYSSNWRYGCLGESQWQLPAFTTGFMEFAFQTHL